MIICDYITTEITCSSPPPVENARLINGDNGDVYQHLEELSYRCEAGHYLSDEDSGSIFCSSSGMWSNPPACLSKSSFLINLFVLYSYEG